MKKTIVAIAFILTSFSVFAQVNKPHFISLNVGVSSPQGDFADTDFFNNKAGYASSGIAFNFEGVKFINANIGFGVKAGSMINDRDAHAMIAELQKYYPGSDPQITTSNYRTTQIMVGPYIIFPIRNSPASIGVKALVGFIAFKSPAFKITQVNNPGAHPLIKQEGTADTFGYDFGVNVRYAFTDRIGCSLNADYVAGNPEVEYFSGVVYEPVSILALTAGLYIRVNQ